MNVNGVRYNFPAFKGYDARPLRGLLMSTNEHGLADTLIKIGKKEGFSVFVPQFNCASKQQELVANPKKIHQTHLNTWAQDYWAAVNGTLLSGREYLEMNKTIRKHFGLASNDIQEYLRAIHGISAIKETISSLSARKWLKVASEATPQPKSLLGRMFKNFSRKLTIDEQIIMSIDELRQKGYLCNVQGGNFFLVRGKNGVDELLIGKDELTRFDKDTLKLMFAVKNVHVLPQMDYHLDLFIRPLDNGRILLADDKLMLSVLNEGIQKVEFAAKNTDSSRKQKQLKLIAEKLQRQVVQLTKAMGSNPYSKSKKIEKVLKKAGFDVIKVPGRMYQRVRNVDDVSLQHSLNFMNAHVLVNDKNELVYITNSDILDRRLGITPEVEALTGFSLRRIFTEALSSYVKEDKIYFLEGKRNKLAHDLLKARKGGIHCMAAEIPVD